MIWPYIFLSYLSLIIFGLCDNIRGPLFPELIAYFSVNNTEGSFFYAAASGFAFFGSWFSVRILKRIDRVQNLYVALVTLGTGLMLAGLSKSFWHIVLAAMVMGVGYGLLSMSYNLLATIGAKAQHRQRIISGLHSMYGLSSFMAPLLVTLIYHFGGKWPQVFFTAGSFCFALAGVGYFFLPKENHVGYFEVSVGSAARKPEGIIIISLAFSGYLIAEIMMGSRLALYLRLNKNFDLDQSSYYVTGFFLALLVSRIFFSILHVRLKVKTQLMTSLLLSCLCLTLGLTVHEGFLVLTGFAMGPFYALSILYLSETFPQVLNQALAVSMAISYFFVVIMHLSLGWLTDHFGVMTAMAVGPVALAIAFLLFAGSGRWIKH